MTSTISPSIRTPTRPPGLFARRSEPWAVYTERFYFSFLPLRPRVVHSRGCPTTRPISTPPQTKVMDGPRCAFGSNVKQSEPGRGSSSFCRGVGAPSAESVGSAGFGRQRGGGREERGLRSTSTEQRTSSRRPKPQGSERRNETDGGLDSRSDRSWVSRVSASFFTLFMVLW